MTVKPLSISQLTSRIRQVLEGGVGEVWVEGEIGNWKQHATSGHCYFSLKDENAQISAVMWRRAAMRLRFEPRNGLSVEVRGPLTFYEAQGRAQIVVEDMHEAGVGLLWKKFLELRDRLEREGLFDPARKRPLPALPRRVGVVTSPSGAALQDILHVLRRRFAGLDIVVWPARVQGEGAARQIAHGIRRLSELDLCDVMIVGRGGGSMEDLWAFNEEVVARAIAACPVPVVSAVGHETDFTIADFVADVRAPTPSAAAELVVGEKAALVERLHEAAARLARAMLGRIDRQRARVESLASSYALTEPRARLFQAMQRRDELAERLERALRVRAAGIEQARRRVAQFETRLARALDRARRHHERRRETVSQYEARLTAALRGRLPTLAARERERAALDRRLERALRERTMAARRAFESVRAQLKTLDPERVLARGYAIVRRVRHANAADAAGATGATGATGAAGATAAAVGRVLTDPKRVRPGEHIAAQLAKGRLRAIVVKDEDDLFA